MSNLEKVAKTIQPSKISSFVNDTRSLADAMEEMQANTPVEDQSMAAAIIFDKYGCL